MRFVVREFDEHSKSNYKDSCIGIGVKENDQIILPSPLSNFIKSEYRNKGKAINSQRNAAFAITRFLNHLFEKTDNYTELIHKGLPALTLNHGADYITYLSLKTRVKELDSYYVKTEIKYINKFYYWMNKQHILNEKFELIYNSIPFGRKNINVESNLFEINDLDIILPTKNKVISNKLKDFGANRNKLILHFIRTAQKLEPLLALGLALQIFGGLRRSEVINLKTSSLKWSNRSLVIEVRDNQKELFPDALNKADLQVKSERDQICLCPEIIKSLYENHVSLLEKQKLKNESALFISYRTLKPLKGKRYSAKLEKIKQHFLDELLENNYMEDYLLLANNRWSTHVGRGIFTNILIDLGLTPTQIALARGDKSIQSSLSYVDEHTLITSMKLAINNFDILKEDI